MKESSRDIQHPEICADKVDGDLLFPDELYQMYELLVAAREASQSLNEHKRPPNTTIRIR